MQPEPIASWHFWNLGGALPKAAPTRSVQPLQLWGCTRGFAWGRGRKDGVLDLSSLASSLSCWRRSALIRLRMDQLARCCSAQMDQRRSISAG
jgi:hypothetical protein